MLVVLGIAATAHSALAAQQRGQVPLTLQAPAENPEDFPLPPIPPDTPPAESAAPVPGSTSAPRQEGGANGPQVSPGFFSQGSDGAGGNGFLSGSTSQSEAQRRSPPAGFKLNVPLQ
jgi:hypothetical protein